MIEPNDLIVNMIPPQRFDSHSSRGLSKREYFAIKCLQGLLADSTMAYPDCEISETMKHVISQSVRLADLLIAELNKE